MELKIPKEITEENLKIAADFLAEQIYKFHIKSAISTTEINRAGYSIMCLSYESLALTVHKILTGDRGDTDYRALTDTTHDYRIF